MGSGECCRAIALQLELECFLVRVLADCRPSPALAEGVHRLMRCTASQTRLEGLQAGTVTAFKLLVNLAKTIKRVTYAQVAMFRHTSNRDDDGTSPDIKLGC